MSCLQTGQLRYSESGKAQLFTSTSRTFVPLPSSEKGLFLLNIYGKFSSYYSSVHGEKSLEWLSDDRAAVTFSFTNADKLTQHNKPWYASHSLEITHAPLAFGNIAPLLWPLESIVSRSQAANHHQ